jgi:hypothetical protein
VREVFPIVPGGVAPFVFAAVIGAIVLGALVALLLFVWGSRFTRFEVSDDGLRIRGDPYGRSIPFASLDLAGARIAPFGAEPALRPVRRTNGSNMPGYSSGWFRMADGGRALLFVTDRDRMMLYLPTTEGYSVLMSPDRPERMLDALRRGAARGGSGT